MEIEIDRYRFFSSRDAKLGSGGYVNMNLFRQILNLGENGILRMQKNLSGNIGRGGKLCMMIEYARSVEWNFLIENFDKIKFLYLPQMVGFMRLFGKKNYNEQKVFDMFFPDENKFDDRKFLVKIKRIKSRVLGLNVEISVCCFYNGTESSFVSTCDYFRITKDAVSLSSNDDCRLAFLLDGGKYINEDEFLKMVLMKKKDKKWKTKIENLKLIFAKKFDFTEKN